MLFPTLSLVLYALVNVFRAKPYEPSVFKYAAEVAFKVFASWKQRVEFPHFFFCDVANAAKSTLADVVNVASCNRIPDYLVFFALNAFSFARAIQSLGRWRETKKFYNQGANMIKYILGILSTLNTISAVKENAGAYWLITTINIISTLY